MVANLAGCGGRSVTSAASAGRSASLSVPAVAPGRGVFFYQLSGNPNGALAIVGNTTAENQMIATLQERGITRVYGSYASLISSNPAAVRAWNALLAQNGIASYTMLSSTTSFLPTYWTSANSWLQNDFLTFNANAAADEQFVGVMLDVEPEAFAGDSSNPSWNAATMTQRRTYLVDLTNFIQQYRTLMNNGAESGAPLDTTLTYWFYQVNQTVGWTSTADMQAWFTTLGSLVNYVSIMDYGTSQTSLIESRYQSNATLLPTGVTSIALSSAIGSEWSSFSQMWTAMNTVESAESVYCDINSYDTLATD